MLPHIHQCLATKSEQQINDMLIFIFFGLCIHNNSHTLNLSVFICRQLKHTYRWAVYFIFCYKCQQKSLKRSEFNYFTAANSIFRPRTENAYFNFESIFLVVILMGKKIGKLNSNEEYFCCE